MFKGFLQLYYANFHKPMVGSGSRKSFRIQKTANSNNYVNSTILQSTTHTHPTHTYSYTHPTHVLVHTSYTRARTH